MIKYKKSLGQNFLTDKNIINKIVNLETIENKKILEIGAGSGNLTNFICQKKPNSVYLIEKDRRFYEILKNFYGKKENFKIFNADILNFDLNKYGENEVIVFGNLPYNISTQILTKFIKLKSWPPFYNKIIFMFQNEVADRILAKPKTSNFGRLSVLANLKLDISQYFKISKKCFFPVPKVDSKIIVFQPKKKIKFKISNVENLEKITHAFFSNRRKMINKTFKKMFIDHLELAKKMNINLSSRPSDLSCETYYRLTEIYEQSRGC